MQKIKTLLKILLAVAFATMAVTGFGYAMFKQRQEAQAEYRQQLIQELCEREDYTFCEIDRIIYKERTDFTEFEDE